MPGELFEALRALERQSRRISIAEEEILQSFRRADESFSLADAAVQIEQRAIGQGFPYTFPFTFPQHYLLAPTDEVTDGDFAALTNWVESIAAGLTATTTRVTKASAGGQAKTEFGSLDSLQVDVTASTATGAAGRYQDLVAAAAQTWSFEVWMKGSAFANAEARLRIEWLDAGNVILSSANAVSTDTAGAWTVRLSLDNQVAPANTAKVRIRAEVNVTVIGGTGKAWFDLVRAEKAASVSDRARRFIFGEMKFR